MAEKRRGGKGKTRVRRRDRKNIPRGRAYVQATFNNTIVYHDRSCGERHRLVERGLEWFQREPQEHAVRSAGHGRIGGAQGHGAWASPGRRLCQGPGFRSRDGYPLIAIERRPGRLDHRYDADSIQRLPPAEASARLVAGRDFAGPVPSMRVRPGLAN